MIELLPSDALLLRLPSWLGDFVLAEPVVRAVAHAVESRRLRSATLVAPTRLLELYEGRFEALARLPSDRGRASLSWRGHSLALLLDGSWRSALRAARAGIGVRLGPARGLRAPLLSHAVRGARERGATPLGLGRSGRWPRTLPRPFGSVAVELANWLGLEVRARRPMLVPTAAGESAARARLVALGLGPAEPFVLVNAGARTGSAKGIPAELLAPRVAELCRAGPRVLLVCAPGEEAAARATWEQARAQVAEPALAPLLLDAPAPGLAELVALLARARLLVTADSGPRHLAVALGVPVMVAFGPTDPRHTADHLAHTHSLRTEVPCGPCHRERCPHAGPARHACWLRIPEQAWSAALAESLASARGS